VVWTGLARLRIGTLVNAGMNLRDPQNAGKFLSSCRPVGVSFLPFEHLSDSMWIACKATGINKQDCNCLHIAQIVRNMYETVREHRYEVPEMVKLFLYLIH
jgi:hypothetical protein